MPEGKLLAWFGAVPPVISINPLVLIDCQPPDGVVTMLAFALLIAGPTIVIEPCSPGRPAVTF